MAEETIQKYKRRYAKTTSDAVSHAQDIDEDTDVFTDDWNLDIPASTDSGKFVQVDYANKRFVYSSVNLSGYATETWVGQQGYATQIEQNGQTYTASNGKIILPNDAVLYVVGPGKTWGKSGTTIKIDKTNCPANLIVGDYVFTEQYLLRATSITSSVVTFDILGTILDGIVGAPYVTANGVGWGISGANRSFDRSQLTPNTPVVGGILYAPSVPKYFKITTVGSGTVACTEIDIPVNYVDMTSTQEVGGTKTFSQPIYLSAATPFVIGKNGKGGFRAINSSNAQVGQMNISDGWYSAINGRKRYGVQISALDEYENKHNQLRVSHNGVQYIQYDNASGTETIKNLATEAWVQAQGYVTQPSISRYATEIWVEEQGYVLTSDINEWTGDNTFIYPVTFGGYYNGNGHDGEIYFRFDQQASSRKVMYSDGHSLNFATQFDAGSMYSPTNVSNMIFRVEGKMYYTHNETGTPTANDEIATKGDISGGGGGGSTLYKHSLTLTAGNLPFKMEFISEDSTAISNYTLFDTYYKKGALKLGTYVKGGKQNNAGLVVFDWDDEEYRVAFYDGDMKNWQYTGYVTAFSDTVTEL